MALSWALWNGVNKKEQDSLCFKHITSLAVEQGRDEKQNIDASTYFSEITKVIAVRSHVDTDGTKKAR